LQDEHLVAAVREKEVLFRSLLVHPAIMAVRSAGLLMAVEFESFEKNKQVIDKCLENGVLTDWFLFAPHCLRIAPPLVISEDEIKFACGVILSCL
jgi:acetylornithine/succinyldiaminopimelate/putrescine aminotransferase